VRRTFFVLLGTLAALDLLVLGIRVASILTTGQIAELPIEGPGLHAVWRLRHGLTLYEWPTQPPFSLTAYNPLFYALHAAVFSAGRIPDHLTPIAGKLVTLAFSASGALLQYAIAVHLVGRGRSRVLLAVVAFLTWFGSLMPGWWSLSMRPDMPAAALSTLGLGTALVAFERDRPHLLVVAGIAFLVAWEFKQSHVSFIAALALYAGLWRRSPRAVALLVGPFAIGVLLTLWAGGAAYRFNIIKAPSFDVFIPYLAFYWYRSVFLPHLLIWAVPLVALVQLLQTLPSSRAALERCSRALFGSDLTALFAVVAVSAVVGAVLLMKGGSALNHLMELNVAAGLLCGVVLTRDLEARTRSERGRFPWLALATLPMLLYTVTLLVNDRSPVLRVLVVKGQSNALMLIHDADLPDRREAARIVTTLPTPVLIHDDLFSLPWFSNGNRRGAVTFDPVMIDTARHAGAVGEGLEGMVHGRYFGAIAMPPDSYIWRAARAAGYRSAGHMPGELRQIYLIMTR
jgi:hypothetical protein